MEEEMRKPIKNAIEIESNKKDELISNLKKALEACLPLLETESGHPWVEAKKLTENALGKTRKLNE